jgi:hypothetical protein
MTNTAALALRFALAILAALVAHEAHIDVEFVEFLDVLPELPHLVHAAEEAREHWLVTAAAARLDALRAGFDFRPPFATA